MKTTNKPTQIQNISDNERGFRTFLALGTLSGVLAGVVTAPTAMFILSATSIYLVTTAIIGSDPVYAIAQRLNRHLQDSHGRSGQIYA